MALPSRAPADSGARMSSTPPGMLLTPVARWSALFILFLVTTSSYFDYYVLSVVLEPIKREFAVSDTLLGLLGGFSFAALYSVTAVPVARWADRGNRRTIITVALVGWSVMTALGGLARSFWQLVVARVGVGMVEPGAVPPAQSLVADYFPPERRGTASSLLNAGSAAGYLVGIGLGGYIAARLGWRMAFVIAGLPGLVLAAVVRFVVPEPRTRLGFPTEATQEGWRQSLQHLRHNRTYVAALAGASLYTIFSFGSGIFLPSFMLRDLHATLAQISGAWAIAISAATLIGSIVGGRLVDALVKRDIRWYGWLPAVACALGAPLYWAALATHSVELFIALDFVAELILAIGLSVSFAIAHTVCGSVRRTQAIALLQLSFMLVGAGFGPLVAGALSDLLYSISGESSLRYSLLIMVSVLLPAAAAFYRSGCTLPGDVED